MMEAPVEKIVPIEGEGKEVFVSNSGEYALVRDSRGYKVFGRDDSIKSFEGSERAFFIKDREIVVSISERTLIFYNVNGGLLWKNTYEEEIKDVSFRDGTGIVLLNGGEVLFISGYSNVLGTAAVPPDVERVILGSRGRYFLLIGNTSIHLYSTNSMAEVWSESFMDRIYDVGYNSNMSRVSVSLETGDFYLLNKFGKRILEFKFDELPLSTFDLHDNLIVAEDENVKIMNERGTLLKRIEVVGKCTSLVRAEENDYFGCGTTKGFIYLLDRSGIVWKYQHPYPISSLDITPGGEFLVGVDRNLMWFNNISKYTMILSEVEGKVRNLAPKHKEYKSLVELYDRMRAAYMKKNFELLLNLKKKFDEKYGKGGSSMIPYALILDSMFSKDRISQNILYVKTKNPVKVRVYGNFRYKIVDMGVKNGVRKMALMLQPKFDGSGTLRIDILTSRNSINLTTKIISDGIVRGMKVLSNVNYRYLIA